MNNNDVNNKTKNKNPENYAKEDKNDITMYTVQDIRRIFRCSLPQAYDLVNAGGFPSIRIGGKILTEKRALESWLDANRGKSVFL